MATTLRQGAFIATVLGLGGCHWVAHIAANLGCATSVAVAPHGYKGRLCIEEKCAENGINRSFVLHTGTYKVAAKDTFQEAPGKGDPLLGTLLVSPGCADVVGAGDLATYFSKSETGPITLTARTATVTIDKRHYRGGLGLTGVGDFDHETGTTVAKTLLVGRRYNLDIKDSVELGAVNGVLHLFPFPLSVNSAGTAVSLDTDTLNYLSLQQPRGLSFSATTVPNPRLDPPPGALNDSHYWDDNLPCCTTKRGLDNGQE